MTTNRYVIEAKDQNGWYDHAKFDTIEAARAEIAQYFDPSFVTADNIKIVDLENMIEVAL